MKIQINVPHRKYEGQTRDDALSKAGLRSLSYSFSKYGNGYTNQTYGGDISHIYGYSLEKHRPRWKQVQKFDKKQNKNITESKKIKDSKWVINVYRFDVKLLDLTGKQIKQGIRTFRLVNKK